MKNHTALDHVRALWPQAKQLTLPRELCDMRVDEALAHLGVARSRPSHKGQLLTVLSLVGIGALAWRSQRQLVPLLRTGQEKLTALLKGSPLADLLPADLESHSADNNGSAPRRVAHAYAAEGAE